MNDLFIFVSVSGLDGRKNDGGTSRIMALTKWLKKNKKNVKYLKLNKSKIHRIIKHLYFLTSVKGSTIFYVHPEYGFDIFSDKKSRKFISKLFFMALKRAKKYNNIIFDVNDLKCEQYKDLEINKYNLNRVQEVENELFKLDAKYIFASNSMRDYAVKKYSLNIENTEVCINGSVIADDKEEKQHQRDVLKFIYAGTLNKGRNIEKLINDFPSDKKYKLILIGPDGEWINEYSKNSNIEYMGSFPELEAHKIANKCDVGLIPYDDTRLYYNLAYPTKLPFYLCSGIPVISTPVDEIMICSDKDSFGWYAGMDSWKELINSLNADDINEKKNNIKKIKNKYTWNQIFSNSKFLNKTEVK